MWPAWTTVFLRVLLAATVVMCGLAATTVLFPLCAVRAVVLWTAPDLDAFLCTGCVALALAWPELLDATAESVLLAGAGVIWVGFDCATGFSIGFAVEKLLFDLVADCGAVEAASCFL
jgi:hypothetical protein